METNNKQDKYDEQRSYLDQCLLPLLQHLGWNGDEALVFESMPHLMNIESAEKFSWVMHNLGYSSKEFISKLSNINEKTLPCLFIPNDDNAPFLVLDKIGDKLSIYDPKQKKEVIVPDSNTTGYVLAFKKKSDEVIKESYRHWFREVLYNAKGMVFFLIFVSFFQAILFIVPPAYIMFLYDKVINTNSYVMLSTFFIGILLALGMMVGMMRIRSRALGYFGSRLQRDIGNLIFIRLLKLQPAYIESAPLAKQMLRINEFNQLRDFFGGPLFSAVVDIPFTVIFLIFIWLIAGWMVLVPIVAVVVYLIVAHINWFMTKNIVRDNSIIRAKYQNYLLETFSGMRSLQYSGLQDVWYKKFKELSALFSLQGRSLLFANSAVESIFDALTIFTGIATIVVGAILIMDNVIQVGALIAVLFVIWRLLVPIKTVAVMYPRLIQVKKSAEQINQLMQFPTEIPAEHQWKSSPRKILGDIRFDQVSFRYPNADTLALKNISFTLPHGKTLLIIGPTGSGKSTIANLMLHIYPIMGGYIYIDGRNIKQFDVNTLRKNISFVPQKSELFYGTIEQNLKIAKPLATHEEVIEAAESANLMDVINSFPDGFETRIRFYGDDRFGASFNQKMNLARAYLRDAPIFLLDEPTSGLDDVNVDSFTDYVKKIKGKKTVVIMGHSKQFIDFADLVIVLFDGFIASAGKPDQVLKNIPEGMI